MSRSHDPDVETLLAFDREHVWHPYASLIDPAPVYPVVGARGVRLELADGRRLIDGMSSWWAAIHGYNHPVLNRALEEQAGRMAHVMFGGLTHPAAVELCRLLVAVTPPSLDKVFLADSGSVAVEVAIKMALQYWYSVGRRDRTRLLTVRSGYHGDTFGAMSVCDPLTGMHHLFRHVLPGHLFAEAPACRFGEPFEDAHIEGFEALISRHQGEIAAVILEPVVQGAGGMRFYSPVYLKRVRELCDACDTLLILDEIATGFGRSGKLFGCTHAGIEPDIMCLGKALTGGYMTLSATLCSARVSDGICRGEAGVFMHGPTFMANPLACAVARASVELLVSQPWEENIRRIEKRLRSGLEPARGLAGVADVRVLGAIGVVEARHPVDVPAVQRHLVEQGVWLRPFGRLLYAMPPYVTSDEDLGRLTGAMVAAAERLPA